MKEISQNCMHFHIFGEEVTHSGNTADEIVRKMKLCDWGMPKTPAQYKERVTETIQIRGETILYWDAMSFLLALQAADIGILVTSDEEVRE